MKARAKNKDAPGRENLPKGIWHPELVARGNYPRTPEIYAHAQECRRERANRRIAEGTWKWRTGVPDGWALRGEELTAIRRAAAVEAKRLVRKMAETGKMTKDGANAIAAMEVAVGIMLTVDPVTRKPIESTSNRLAAAKVVLEYTKAKPAQKVEASITKAEDFLALLAKK